jgi:hypothetical protein
MSGSNRDYKRCNQQITTQEDATYIIMDTFANGKKANYLMKTGFKDIFNDKVDNDCNPYPITSCKLLNKGCTGTFISKNI